MGNAINQLLHSGHGLEVNAALGSAALTSRPAPHAINPIQCSGGTITSMCVIKIEIMYCRGSVYMDHHGNVHCGRICVAYSSSVTSFV